MNQFILPYPENIKLISIIITELTQYIEHRTIELFDKKKEHELSKNKPIELTEIEKLNNEVYELEILNLLLYSKLIHLRKSNLSFEQIVEILNPMQILLIIRALFHTNPVLHISLIRAFSDTTYPIDTLIRCNELY